MGEPDKFSPDNPDTRKLIDAHKKTRLQDPYRRAAYRKCVDDPGMAFVAWVEQIGDAELYEQAYREGTK